MSFFWFPLVPDPQELVTIIGQSLHFIVNHFFFFFFFRFFWGGGATLTAHGGSQARGLIRAIAAGLGHSNARSELCL